MNELSYIIQSQVDDVSGGCGSMFNLEVEAEQFRGLSLVKQHKLVTGILKKEIVDMVRSPLLISINKMLLHRTRMFLYH